MIIIALVNTNEMMVQVWVLAGAQRPAYMSYQIATPPTPIKVSTFPFPVSRNTDIIWYLIKMWSSRFFNQSIQSSLFIIHHLIWFASANFKVLRYWWYDWGDCTQSFAQHAAAASRRSHLSRWSVSMWVEKAFEAITIVSMIRKAPPFHETCNLFIFLRIMMLIKRKMSRPPFFRLLALSLPLISQGSLETSFSNYFSSHH